MTAETITPVTSATTALAVDVRDALTATILSAGKSTIVPVLQSVKLDKVGNTLTFTSTDRYRLTVVTLTLQDDNGSDFSTLLPLASAKRFVAALPKRSSGYSSNMTPVSFRVDEQWIEMSTFDGATKSDIQDGEYPNLASIIAEPTADPKGWTEIRFDPAFMIDLCKMPGRGKKDSIILDLPDSGTRKPMRSTWDSGYVSYLHLIMPQLPR